MSQTHSASRAIAADGSRVVPGLNPQGRPDAVARWRDAVSVFLQTVGPDLESLEERLEQLKEDVAERLRPLTANQAGSADTRVVLELDADGSLRFAGPAGEAAKPAPTARKAGEVDAGDETTGAETHPADAETEGLMRTLAVESALMRCVEELRDIDALLHENRVARSCKPALAIAPAQTASPSGAACAAESSGPAYPPYQVCLKGELSHFYFPRS